MPTFRLNKLVRDKIVEDMIATGQNPVYRKLAAGEHRQALISKLAEEAQELAAANDADMLVELADVQQVIDELVQLAGITKDQLRDVQTARLSKRGGFARGLFVETVDLADGNVWTAYYRKTPDKSPEVTSS